MNERKLGNPSQIRFAQEIVIADKRCILVQNGELELLFNKDNALDIVWAKYKGVNLSFLSKNGLNDGARDFVGNFEGGFLYTCGMDNVSGCVAGKPVHGSLHYKKCDLAHAYEKDGALCIYGEVKESALFGKNLVLKRKIYATVGGNSVTIEDTLVNEGYKDEEYCLLYHINVGYPMLDNGAKIIADVESYTPRTAWAKQNEATMYDMNAPMPNQEETCYFLNLKKPEITLVNEKIGKEFTVSYAGDTLPHFVEWKSMASGDYALGLEPCTTELDDGFTYRTIKKNEQVKFFVRISIDKNCSKV